MLEPTEFCFVSMGVKDAATVSEKDVCASVTTSVAVSRELEETA